MTALHKITRLLGYLSPQSTQEEDQHPFDTPDAQKVSYALGRAAGLYITAGGSTDYARLKSECRILIEQDRFNAAFFQNGHKDAYGDYYDFDQFSGDMFEIGDLLTRRMASQTAQTPSPTMLGRIFSRLDR